MFFPANYSQAAKWPMFRCVLGREVIDVGAATFAKVRIEPLTQNQGTVCRGKERKVVATNCIICPLHRNLSFESLTYQSFAPFLSTFALEDLILVAI